MREKVVRRRRQQQNEYGKASLIRLTFVRRLPQGKANVRNASLGFFKLIVLHAKL